MAIYKNVSFGALAYQMESYHLSEKNLLKKLVGESHQLGNPNSEAGESWDDPEYAPVRIVAARVIRDDSNYAPSLYPEGYIVVDVTTPHA